MSESGKPTPTRRSLLGAIWLGLGAVVTAELVWVVAAFLAPAPAGSGRRRRRPRRRRSGGAIRTGIGDRLPAGKFYLVRLDDGGFLALLRSAPTSAAPSRGIGSEEAFVCPCHASTFDMHGAVLGPPAPRPLDLFTRAHRERHRQGRHGRAADAAVRAFAADAGGARRDGATHSRAGRLPARVDRRDRAVDSALRSLAVSSGPAARTPDDARHSHFRRPRELPARATRRPTRAGTGRITTRRWTWPTRRPCSATSTTRSSIHRASPLGSSAETAASSSHTEGPDGSHGEFEIAYIFGVEPLQQYLVPFPGGGCRPDHRLGQRARRVVRPLPRRRTSRRTTGCTGRAAPELERHVRRVPLHQPAQEGYDPATQTFDTTWSEIDVSCEACHGPASRHVEWAEIPPMARPDVDELRPGRSDTGDISRSEQVELCAPCHSRRTELGDYDHTRVDLLDNLMPVAAATRASTTPTGRSWTRSTSTARSCRARCSATTCAAATATTSTAWSCTSEGNELCLQCHRADAYDSLRSPLPQEGPRGPAQRRALCVKCHMPERPYMVVDWRADHSLRVPRPDLSRRDRYAQRLHPGRLPRRQVRRSGRRTLTGSGTGGAAGRTTARSWPRAPSRRPEARRGADPAGRRPALPGDRARHGAVPARGVPRRRERPGLRTGPCRTTMPWCATPRSTSLTSPDPSELVELLAPLLFDPVAGGAHAGRGRGWPDVPDGRCSSRTSARRSPRRSRSTSRRWQYSLDFAFAGHNLGNLYDAHGRCVDQAEQYYRERHRDRRPVLSGQGQPRHAATTRRAGTTRRSRCCAR